MHVLGLPALLGAVRQGGVPLHAAVRVAGPDRPRSTRNLVLEQLVRDLFKRAALLAVPRAELVEARGPTRGTRLPPCAEKRTSAALRLTGVLRPATPYSNDGSAQEESNAGPMAAAYSTHFLLFKATNYNLPLFYRISGYSRKRLKCGSWAYRCRYPQSYASGASARSLLDDTWHNRLIFQAGVLESSRMDVGLGALAAMPRMGSDSAVDASAFPAVPVWRLSVAEGTPRHSTRLWPARMSQRGSVPRPLRFCVLKRGKERATYPLPRKV